METINIIQDTLIEELERNERSQRVYEQEIAALPRGSVTVRMRRQRAYCYLKYRDGSKTRTDYVGLEAEVGEELRHQVERRRSLQETLKRLKHEHSFIERALRKR